MYLLLLALSLLILVNRLGSACELRTFVGTNKGCKWLACSPQAESGVCAFSSSILLDAIDQSFGLNLTALEGDLQKCFDASRVLLSMLVVNSTSRAVRELAPLAPLLLAPARMPAASVPAAAPSAREPADEGADLAGAHAERAVLQASASTSTGSVASSPSLPQALAQVSQCPTSVPQGVADVAAAQELLSFVMQRCRDISGVPAAYVFGDIVGVGQVADATVCLPSEIQRDAFVAAEACLAQNTQDQCLEQILEMWNVDVGTAKAVAGVNRAANSTCVYGGVSAGGDSASTSADGPAASPSSRAACLVDRSAAVAKLVRGMSGSVSATPRSSATTHRQRAAAAALLAGVVAVVGVVGMG